MRQHAISFKNVKSLTKQSFKDECDINKILKKFEKTGAITHYTKNAPQYGDTTSPMLHDAMNIIANAESMFEELPAQLRKKFNNDPGTFLDFVQDENNLEEMRELGLTKKGINIPTTTAANNVTEEQIPAATTNVETSTDTEAQN